MSSCGIAIIGDTPFVNALAKITKSTSITVQDIANPNSTVSAVDGLIFADNHSQLLASSIARGKAILASNLAFCSIEEINKIISTVRKYKTRFHSGFVRRHDTRIQHVKHELEKGTLGAIQQINLSACYSRLDPFISGSENIFTALYQEFDTLRFLTGTEIQTIAALCDTEISKDLQHYSSINAISLSCTLDNGTMANINIAKDIEFGFDYQVDTIAELGHIATADREADELVFTDTHGSHKFTSPKTSTDYFANAYQRLFNHFVAFIAGEVEPTADIYDALVANACVQAAYQSLTEARVVSLHEIL